MLEAIFCGVREEVVRGCVAYLDFLLLRAACFRSYNIFLGEGERTEKAGERLEKFETINLKLFFAPEFFLFFFSRFVLDWSSCVRGCTVGRRTRFRHIVLSPLSTSREGRTIRTVVSLQAPY